MSTDLQQPDMGDRRRRARQARDAFPPMGVFAVRDRTSGRVWMGSSRDVHARLNRIQFELRLGAHMDKQLQAAWQQDPARLSFEVVALVKQRTDPAFDHDEELRVLEQLYREELCGEAP
jgi:hypothetical protein